MSLSRVKRLLLALLVISLLCPFQLTWAATTQQANQQASNNAPVCDQTRALLLAQQQATEAKTLDQPAQRITILVRAADLIWSRQQEAARAILTEAYDVAQDEFKKKGDESHLENDLVVFYQDQRFIVLTVIARHDPQWAKRLAESAAEDTRREAEKATTSNASPFSGGDKLIGLAFSLLAVDQQVALNLVRSSFRYPASSSLMWFLYKLAQTNASAADQLYREAINAQANPGLTELAYLAVYPFALNREAGPVPVGTYYTPPKNFVASSTLQQLFLETLFRQIEQNIKAPVSNVEGASPSSDTLPESARAFIILNSLEPLIAQSQPTAIERAANLKGQLIALLNVNSQKQATEFARERQEASEEANTFEKLSEEAEKETDPAKQDWLIARAVWNASDRGKIEEVESLIQKTNNPKTRGQLLNWFYYKAARKAIKAGRFDQATQLIKKVETAETRALLSFELASAFLKRQGDEVRAREALLEVESLALKAPNTGERSRTLIGLVQLYARFDRLHAQELMGEVVKTINRIPDPNRENLAPQNRIDGSTFTIYLGDDTSAYNLENAFRELGSFDFESVVWQAKNLEDKFVRLNSMLAIAAPCLEKPPTQDKPSRQEKPDRKTSQKAISHH
jgi:hypothetical protein